MIEVLFGICGLALGLAWTRRSGHRISGLLRQRRSGVAIAATTTACLLPIIALLTLLVLRWPTVAVGALAGYWCGRTAWLAYVASGRGWEE